MTTIKIKLHDLACPSHETLFLNTARPPPISDLDHVCEFPVHILHQMFFECSVIFMCELRIQKLIPQIAAICTVKIIV